jgi:transposase-like protein
VSAALSQESGSSEGDGQITVSHGSAFVSPPSLPAEIIQHAIWLYLRFTLSYRDVEELLAERGLDVSYETVPRWVL